MKKLNLRQHLVAHRGDHQFVEENSLLAIKNALKQDALYLEFDIQLTKDLIPIAIHNDFLPCNKGQCLFDIEAKEIIKTTQYSSEKLSKKSITTPLLATLAEIVVCINSDQNPTNRTVFVEVKKESIQHFGISSVLKAISPILKLAQFNPVVTSYHYDFVLEAKKKMWEVGWVSDTLEPKVLKLLETLKPDYMFSRAKALLRYNIPVSPWIWASYTSNTLKQVQELISRGVNLVETDHFAKIINTHNGEITKL